MFGVSGELMWSPIRVGDPSLAELYREIGLHYIRFPGGTTANYYRWEAEDFGCAKQPDQAESERIRRFNRALSMNDRTYSTEDFLAFIRQSGSDFALVINVLCDTPEQSGKWMAVIRDQGVNVTHVEMGNELYYPLYRWGFNTAQEYSAAAIRHAEKIRAVYPKVKVGMVASSSSFRSKLFPDLGRMRERERDRRGVSFDALSAAAGIGDAVIVHLYSPFDNFSSAALKKLSEWSTAQRNSSVYRNAIAYFDDRALPSLHYLKSLAPTKELWVSEWGIAFYQERRQYEKDFTSSFRNALFVMNGLLTYFSSGIVDSANYHPFVQVLPGSAGDNARNPTFRAMGLLRKPLDVATLVSTVQLTEATGALGAYSQRRQVTRDINAVFIYGDDLGYLMLVNKYGSEYTLESLSVEGAWTVVPQARITMTSLDGVFPDPSSQKLRVQKEKISASDSIVIPPYSISRISVGIRPSSP